jgi:hypothetical protein
MDPHWEELQLQSKQGAGLRGAIWLRNPGGGATSSLSKVSLSPWDGIKSRWLPT